MPRKTLIWIGILVGSTVGSLIPMLWNASLFSMSSLFLSALGGFVGLWFGFNFGD